MIEGKKSFYQWQRPSDTYRSVDENGDCQPECGCDECMSERFDAVGMKISGKRMDIDSIKQDWCNPVLTRQRKPTIESACDVVTSLLVEISKINQELEKERRRQDINEQKYKTMLMEIQNTVSSYT